MSEREKKKKKRGEKAYRIVIKTKKRKENKILEIFFYKWILEVCKCREGKESFSNKFWKVKMLNRDAMAIYIYIYIKIQNGRVQVVTSGQSRCKCGLWHE